MLQKKRKKYREKKKQLVRLKKCKCIDTIKFQYDNLASDVYPRIKGVAGSCDSDAE